MNGYPLKLTRSVISQGNATRKEWTETISIFYVPGKSEAIRRILNKVDIQVAFASQNPLGKALSKVEDDISMEDQKNSVYKLSCNDWCSLCRWNLTCTCRSNTWTPRPYTQNPKNMVDFENLERSSTIALRAIEHLHSINFEPLEILPKNWHIYRERITAEQWYINNEETACNTKKKSLHPSWNLL